MAITKIFEENTEWQSDRDEFFHSGSLALDWITSGRVDGSGGWPEERVSEIHGVEFSGKSLFCIRAAAEFQKKHGDKALIFIDDNEQGVQVDFCKKLGLDLNSQVIITSLSTNPAIALSKYVFDEFKKKHKGIQFGPRINNGFASSETAEECFLRVRAMIHNKELNENYRILYIVDSIAGLSCEYEKHYQGTRVDQGQRAKAIKQGLRLTQEDLPYGHVSVLMTNHEIAGADGVTSSSGGGPKYHASVRVYLTHPTKIRGESKEAPPTGVKLRANCVKTRYVAPYRKTMVSLDFEKGVNRYDGIVDILTDKGILTANKGWYTIKGDEKKYRESDIVAKVESGEINLGDVL